MLESVHFGISFLFGILSIGIIVWYYYLSKSKILLIALSLWAIMVSLLAYQGFFIDYESIPPKITLGIIPMFITMLVILVTKKGQAFVDGLDLEKITYANIIRIPVEIGLALLAHEGVISVWQTFEGANFDILAGLTAPIMAYLFFAKKQISRSLLLIWNIGCLCLLTTIIIISTLAVPSPFQQIAFDQPNIAIFYFPFNLLPMVIVPLVFFGHLVSIRRLRK